MRMTRDSDRTRKLTPRWLIQSAGLYAIFLVFSFLQLNHSGWTKWDKLGFANGCVIGVVWLAVAVALWLKRDANTDSESPRRASGLGKQSGGRTFCFSAAASCLVALEFFVLSTRGEWTPWIVVGFYAGCSVVVLLFAAGIYFYLRGDTGTTVVSATAVHDKSNSH